MAEQQRIAVIGGGISGLATAWLLQDRYRVTLFEAEARLGGHTNTVEVTLGQVTCPVDTGFLVFNERTYPNLIALFDLLGVRSTATEMSFSVSLENPDLEWAGSSLATVFGQKRNLLRKPFWAMLSDILRFNRESVAWLAAHPGRSESLQDFLVRGNYSPAFSDWYLLPMAAAIWSCPTGQILGMPLATFVRFCNNHGLLQIFDRPVWRTVLGGGREYVAKLAATLPDIRLGAAVRQVVRTRAGWQLDQGNESEYFDQIVLACHSDQALRIAGGSLTEAQRAVLSAITYQPNRALLHTDAALLPRNRQLWSAWNYFAGNGEPGHQPVGVSYLINKLQPLPFSEPVVVTLNPAREPAADKVLAEFDYAHPVFDAGAIAAQQRLADIQGQGGLWLAGAWGGYGFHEDGLKSALQVANALGVRAPWQASVQPQAALLAME